MRERFFREGVVCAGERKNKQALQKKRRFCDHFWEKNGKNPGIKTHGVWPKKNSSELSS